MSLTISDRDRYPTIPLSILSRRPGHDNRDSPTTPSLPTDPNRYRNQGRWRTREWTRELDTFGEEKRVIRSGSGKFRLHNLTFNLSYVTTVFPTQTRPLPRGLWNFRTGGLRTRSLRLEGEDTNGDSEYGLPPSRVWCLGFRNGGFPHWVSPFVLFDRP